jgi:hypothetical protein
MIYILMGKVLECYSHARIMKVKGFVHNKLNFTSMVEAMMAADDINDAHVTVVRDGEGEGDATDFHIQVPMLSDANTQAREATGKDAINPANVRGDIAEADDAEFAKKTSCDCTAGTKGELCPHKVKGFQKFRPSVLNLYIFKSRPRAARRDGGLNIGVGDDGETDGEDRDADDGGGSGDGGGGRRASIRGKVTMEQAYKANIIDPMNAIFELETTDPIAAWRLFNDIKKQVKTSTAAATAIARGDVEQGVQFLKTSDGDVTKKRRKDWLEGGMNRSKQQCNHAPLISTKKKAVPRDNGKNPTRQPAIALEKHEAERSKVASEKEKKVETLKLKMAAMWREAKDVEGDSDLKTVRLFDFDLAGKLQHADILSASLVPNPISRVHNRHFERDSALR